MSPLQIARDSKMDSRALKTATTTKTIVIKEALSKMQRKKNKSTGMACGQKQQQRFCPAPHGWMSSDTSSHDPTNTLWVERYDAGGKLVKRPMTTTSCAHLAISASGTPASVHQKNEKNKTTLMMPAQTRRELQIPQPVISNHDSEALKSSEP